MMTAATDARTTPGTAEPSPRIRRGLDALNFFLADVRKALEEWDPGTSIG